MKTIPELTYALCDGAPVHISDTAGRQNSQYICPACGETVEIKSGGNASLYFAHRMGSGCGYERELSLRFALKESILRLGSITIPPVYIEFPTQKAPILLSEARNIVTDKADLVNISDNIIPDIRLSSGNKKLLVTVRTDKTVNVNYREKLIKNGFSSIEIDLSQTIDSLYGNPDSLFTDYIQGENRKKRWIYNAVADNYLKLFISVSERLPVWIRGTELTVERCPRVAQSRSGRRYANFINDCCGCEYFIDRVTTYKIPYNDPRSYISKEYILCSGKNKVSSLKDLEKYMNR